MPNTLTTPSLFLDAGGIPSLGSPSLLAILQTVGLVFWECDCINEKVSFYPTGVLDYLPTEISARFDDWIETFHPEDVALCQAALKSYLNGNVPVFRAEVRCQSKSGAWKWILINGVASNRKDDQTPSRMTGLIWDIHHQKAEYKSLQRAYQFQTAFNELIGLSLRDLPPQDLLSWLLEHVLSASMLDFLEPRGAIFLLDKKHQLLGLAAQKNLDTIWHPPCDQIAFGQCLCGKAAADRKPLFIVKNLGPAVSCVQDNPALGHLCIPLVGSGDKLLGVLALFARSGMELDVNESAFVINVAQFLAGIIERTSTQDNLFWESSRLKQFMDTIPTILIGVDSNNLIVEWNQAAEKTFNIPAEAALGHDFTACTIPWQWTETLKNIPKIVTSHQPLTIKSIRFKKPNGELGFLSLTVTSVQDSSPNASRYLLVGRDITEYTVMEMQLLHAQKMESIGQLAAGIAHEINTPIQYVGDNIRFFQEAFGDLSRLLERFHEAQAACQSGHLPEAMQQEISSLAKEIDSEYLLDEIPKAILQSLEGVDRVSKIVRALKGFAHPGTAGEKSPVNLNQAVENTITVARNEWKYVADMETHLDPSLPMVPCLPGEINQVILNIIVNAAHAIDDVIKKQPGTKGRITISTRAENNWAEIRIADTGAGIPPEIRDRVFDPFFTTKEVGKGTGQGLAISRSVVVDKHGGTIDFESQLGSGTVFIIRLPLGEAAE
ncbi:MAG: ATP-binding protein [candidate division FCPU426 bacterium]